MIKLIDVLNLMDDFDVNGKPKPFSIRFKTVDGEEVYIELGIKCVGKKNGELVLDKPKSLIKKKNPNHYSNATRNIYIPQSGQIRKCKIRLITHFNEQKVVY